MLKSMTGFGRAAISNDMCDLKIEIKSVNSKYCDINLRMPKVFSSLEIPLRALIQEKLVRGKADVTIEARFQKPVQCPVINKPNVMASLSILEQIKEMGQIQDEITLAHLMHFQDLVEYDTSPQVEELEGIVREGVSECLDKIDAMRAAEGKNLETNINHHLNILDSLVKKVDEAKNEIFSYWVDRFKSRLAELTPNMAEYNDRIVQEASIYAEKADIKEEITRIYSHQKEFRKIMLNEFPSGKKLDFLCQEMYREWNTIASKSLKADIINTVVEAKAAVDSVREQIQNVI